MADLRILIVDDEPLALERMSDLLAQIDGVEIVGAAEGGADAISAIISVRPDLVLLDVEMPRVDGFDVIESLLRQDRPDESAAPLICFVTAYPQFATEAFDSGALDYLCKPVRLMRLQKTVVRARAALEQREASGRLHELSTQIEALRKSLIPAEDRFLWVQQRGEMVRLDISALDWLEAEGEYVRIHAGEKSFLFRSSMNAICDELSSDGFVRIHRSVAINRDRLQAIRRKRSGVKVILESGAELPVGRKFRHAIEVMTADVR
jgi:DNA-binding LytR/AlgR family response regulator